MHVFNGTPVRVVVLQSLLILDGLSHRHRKGGERGREKKKKNCTLLSIKRVLRTWSKYDRHSLISNRSHSPPPPSVTSSPFAHKGVATLDVADSRSTIKPSRLRQFRRDRKTTLDPAFVRVLYTRTYIYTWIYTDKSLRVAVSLGKKGEGKKKCRSIRSVFAPPRSSRPCHFFIRTERGAEAMIYIKEMLFGNKQSAAGS